VNIEFTPDDRLKGADKALDDLFEKYGVELRYDENNDYFFVVAEPEKPKPTLKSV